MAALLEKFYNFAEYLGVRSPSYYHALTPASYDPSDFMAYYIDESGRVDYAGPYDPDGIPLYRHAGRDHYFPILICLCALAHLARFRRTEDERDHQFFVKMARWLVASQKENGLWLSEPGMPKYGLPGPWPSALMQGLGISCLARASRLTGNEEYLEHARRALAPFRVRLEDGGVAGVTDGRVFYEEYPAIPTCHVLNGFIFSLWGLYDLTRLENNDEASRLFADGLTTLIEWLPRYDIGYWSLYHIGAGRENPASIHYHRLHIEQLAVMGSITGKAVFGEYHARWQGYLHGRFNALRTLPNKLRWNLRKAL